MPVHLGELPGVSLCSISAHKIGGPKGIGAIFVRERKGVNPLLHGGGQQGGLRPGTEMCRARSRWASRRSWRRQEQAGTRTRLAAIRDAVQAALLAAVPDLVVHSARVERGPNILSASVPGTDSEAMLMHLDLAGLCCASGSACSTGAVEPSHVLTAMGVSRDLAVAAVRMSFGALSTMDQVPEIAARFGPVVAKVRKLREVLARA